MDVDAAGLPFLKNMDPPAGRKSVQQLAEIIRDTVVPFIVKGINDRPGALKAEGGGRFGHHRFQSRRTRLPE